MRVAGRLDDGSDRETTGGDGGGTNPSRETWRRRRRSGAAPPPQRRTRINISPLSPRPRRHIPRDVISGPCTCGLADNPSRPGDRRGILTPSPNRTHRPRPAPSSSHRGAPPCRSRVSAPQHPNPDGVTCGAAAGGAETRKREMYSRTRFFGHAV